MADSLPPQFCAACGAALDPGGAYCANCGAAVASRPAPSPEVAEPVNAVPAAPIFQKRWIAIGAALLLLALMAVGAATYVLRHFGGASGGGDATLAEGYPVRFSDEIRRQFPTPAQLVYYHFISQTYEANQGRTAVGSPRLTDRQVDIQLPIDGRTETWRTVETENDGRRALVAVGLADAGAYEFYVLEQQRGEWVIVGTQATEFP